MFINYAMSLKKCSRPNMYVFILSFLECEAEKYASHIKKLAIVFIYSQGGDCY